MSDDLVKRLRVQANRRSGYAHMMSDGSIKWHPMLDDAADEIERLTAERDALRALLRGATAVLEPVSFNMYDHDIREAARVMVSYINAALNKEGE